MNRKNLNNKEEIEDDKSENVQTRFFDKTEDKTFIKNTKALHNLIQFLNIKEQLQFMLINKQIKRIISNSQIYKKYIELRKEFCNINKKHLVSKNRKTQKKKSPVKYGISYYILKNHKNKKNDLKNSFEKISNSIDFNKIIIEDLINNNGEKINEYAKKYNLNSYEKNSIFSGLIEAKLNLREEEEEEQFKNCLVYNNNIQDCIFNISSSLTYNKSDFKYIDLSNNNFDFNHIKIISQIINLNSESLERLNLSNNKLDDQCVKILFNILLNCSNLKYLNLSRNKISNKGLDYTEDFFSNNSSLENLNISNNLLGEEGLSYFLLLIEKKKNIKKLDISYNGIEKHGISSICDYIKLNNNLHYLSIGGNYICDEGVKILIDFLINNESQIKYLSLENNNISKEKAEDISNLISKYHSLNSLNLKSNNLGNEGVEIIFSNPDFKLSEIDISNNNLTSFENIYNLINNNNTIKHLKLDYNKFEINSFPLLKNILLNEKNNLITLSLNKCQIYDNIFLIFEGLQENKTLINLNLSRNRIGLYNKEFETIIPCLKNNKTLKRLNLDSNRLNDDSLKIILNAINENESLNNLSLNNNDFSKELIYKFLNEIKDKKIQRCEFLNCGISDEEIRKINKEFMLDNLKYLYIEGEEQDEENQYDEEKNEE